MLGNIEARIFTPPLRELNPTTSYGFAVIDFARDVLMEPLDPWQEWAVIHAGELLEDGRPRFRTVLILVARQNGKTHLLKVLALFWLFIEQWSLIVGMSTNLDYAREAWEKTVEAAEENETLKELIGRNGIRLANGQQVLKTVDGCRYKIAASNRKGGRSLTIYRLIIDELREHENWEAWNASTNATNAVPEAQIFCISNQGDDKSAVLNSLRKSAIDYIETGQGDDELGLLEWSAVEGADLLDVEGWKAANPNLGYRIRPNVIRGPAQRAKTAGGEEETGFRTEVLCQRVKALDAAVDRQSWEDDYVPGDLTNLRSRIALCLDVSPDQRHATLVAAAIMMDGRARVEVVETWEGSAATRRLRDDLPGWIKKIKPVKLGWMPNGPAASLGSDLSKRKDRLSWQPANLQIEEIRGEVAGVCMAFAELVRAHEVVHNSDPLMNSHVLGSAKLWTGDTWRFSRKGEGHCDAAYAAAGAVHLALTMPAKRSARVPNFLLADQQEVA